MEHEKKFPHTPEVLSVNPSATVSSRQSISANDSQTLQAANDKTKTAEATESVDEWKAGKQEYLIVLCLATISLMVALDASIIVPPLPNIATAINANAVQAFWIGAAYLVPYAVCQPLIASLSDIFGRRELLLFCVICFMVGSIVPALAHHVTQMLVGRVIQGIGGGGISCLTVSINENLQKRC